jgi:membrane associated rhomboid family serine protease
MSLYDRDYYREDLRRAPGASPVIGLSITTWLIVVNVAMFFLSYVVASPPDTPIAVWWHSNFLLHPFAVFGQGKVWQLLTCTFLHADLWHLLFNMFSLWMFGRGLETLYGRREFLAFYLEAGVLASFAFALSAVARGDGTPALGASGSVFGVIALYAIHYPKSKVYVWGILPLRVWQLAILLVGGTLWAMIQASGGSIAHAAHLGGALYGGAFWLFDLRLSRILAVLRGLRSRPAPPRAPPAWPPEDAGFRTDDDGVRRRVDQLLDKISRQGLASLTDEEREFLNEASRKYRS